MINLLMLITICLATIEIIIAQHENIPYANVEHICQLCNCQTEPNNFELNCEARNFEHILARWPNEFGTDHTGQRITVIFSGNKIPLLQQLPPTTAQLSFSCRHCQINEIQIPTFLDCPNLYRLDLSWNQLTGDNLTPDIFRGPYNETAYETIALHELDLSYNQIDYFDGNLFEHTMELRILSLAGNQFDKINTATADAINSIKSLEYLDLSWNKLRTLPDQFFVKLPKIHTIFIQGNHFEIIPHAIKKVAATLNTLDLSSNQIDQFNYSSFNNLVNLRFLNISGMDSLTTIELGTFSTLTNLEGLFCSNNRNLAILHLPTASTKLKTLDISNNMLTTVISDPNLIHIESNTTITKLWPNMKNIRIGGNPWNCDCNVVTLFLPYSEIMEEITLGQAICSSPHILVGSILKNLSAVEICNPTVATPYRHTFLQRLLRPKSIALIIILIAFAIIIGILVGCGVVFAKQRLRKNIFSISSSEIRYTTVRNT